MLYPLSYEGGPGLRGAQLGPAWAGVYRVGVGSVVSVVEGVVAVASS